MARRFGWPVTKLREGNNHTELYRFNLLQSSDTALDDADLESIIQEKWAIFLNQHYPIIREALERETWLWDANVVMPPLPITQYGIGQFVKGLIGANLDLRLYNDGKNYVNFGLCEWDVPGGYRWKHADDFWLVHFNFVNNPSDLTVCLGVEPGDEVDRERLLQMMRRRTLVGTRPNKLTKNWSALTSYPILWASDYEKTQEEVEALISEKWATFLRDELPRIVQVLRDEEWLWAMP